MMDGIEERLRTDENTIVWKVKTLPKSHVTIDTKDPLSTIKQAESVGIREFYICTEPEGGYPGVAWKHNGIFHKVVTGEYHLPESLEENELSQETDPEKERRDELCDEILTNYRKYLASDEIYRLEEKRELLRVENLLRMRDRLEEEASADPEVEEEAAEWLADHENFGLNSAKMDAEMLLEDSHFDMSVIRVEPVRKRARAIINTRS